MKVRWSAEAAHRLREIAAYIGRTSPTAAQRVVTRLLDGSRGLAKLPLLGRRLPELPDSDLRQLLVPPYRLIYVKAPRGIEIVTIMHYRQLLPSDFGTSDEGHSEKPR